MGTLEMRTRRNVRQLLVITCLSALALTAGVSGQEKDSGSQAMRQRSESLKGRFKTHAVGGAFEQYTELVTSAEYASRMPAWRPLGPTGFLSGHTLDNSVNMLGRINTLAFHPTEPTILYAGAPNGGLWKKTGNERWSPLLSPLNARLHPEMLSVSGIAIDPTDANKIYLLTGDGNGWAGGLPAIPSFGVMKSIDGGHNWSNTGLVFEWSSSNPAWGFQLVIDPCNHEVLYAVTNHGIWKTENAGNDWPRLDVDGDFRDLELRPAPPEGCSQSTSVLYAATTQDIRYSTDGGTTWNESEISLPDDFAKQAADGNTGIELAVAATNNSYVYAVAGEEGQGLIGVYRSTDEGKTFSIRSNAPNIIGYHERGEKTGSEAYYTLTAAVSPVNAEDIHVHSMNAWRSLDGGVTWSITSYWQRLGYISYKHSDTHLLAFSKVKRPHATEYDLYAATDGGVFRVINATHPPLVESSSSSPAALWESVSDGLRITQIFRMCGTPSDPDLFYIGCQDNGSYRLGSANPCHGQWMADVQTGCSIANSDGGSCMINYQNPDIAYVTKTGGRIVKVTGAGRNVVSATPPADNDARNAQSLMEIAMDPIDPDIIYGCYDDLWRSTNGGSVWARVNKAGDLTDESCQRVVVTRRDADSDGFIYVAKNQDKAPPILFWSRDGGDTWNEERIPKLLDGQGGDSVSDDHAGIVDMASSHDEQEVVWLTGMYPGEAQPGVFRFDATEGKLRSYSHKLILSESSFEIGALALAIAYGGKTSENLDRVYIGTQIGVFYGECDDATCHWLPFMDFPFIVLDLEIYFHPDHTPKKLAAATYGQGLWALENPLPREFAE